MQNGHIDGIVNVNYFDYGLTVVTLRVMKTDSWGIRVQHTRTRRQPASLWDQRQHIEYTPRQS
jgi:hypothetical protein